MSAQAIDLNADLGEGAGEDEALLRVVTSASVACGGHAGNADSMIRTLRLANARGVAVGAHPSYPDRKGFGRRTMFLPLAALRDRLTGQVESLRAAADRVGVPLRHLKPHGALYNDASRDAALAAMLADLTATLLPGAALVGPPGSATARAAAARGVPYLAEGFADRAYEPDGGLTPRSEPDAVIAEAERPGRAVRLATEAALPARGGGTVRLAVDTICLHGDAPGAGAAGRAVRDALEAAGVRVSRG